MRNLEPVNFITFSQAQDLVERIATRAQKFKYTMSEPEKEAMADLLSNTGVKTSDLIDVSNLADNYAINAEIVSSSEIDSYEHTEIKNIENNALFSWKENNETHYCLSW
jgi:hypothetical protein